MNVSDVILRVRYELAEPIPSEWKDLELVSYVNDGFSIAWRLAAELHHSLVERTDLMPLLAGESVIEVDPVPLKVIAIHRENRPLSYRIPSEVPALGLTGNPTVWTLEGVDRLRFFPVPEEDVALSVRWTQEPQMLRLEPSTLTDDTIPLPSAVIDMLVQFVIMKAHNRLGGHPSMETNMVGQYQRDVMRALETREPGLVTCGGDWLSVRRR